MEHSLNKYLINLLPETKDWVQLLEDQAELESVPIMDRLGINFLMQMIRIKQPKSILEIGTAIGYSSLRMHEAYPEAKIVTIERDSQLVKQAKTNIQNEDKAKNIHVIHGDALDHMVELSKNHEPFDLIFIDAAKSKYKQFFKQATPLLADEGIILTDNVLFRGYVVEKELAHPRHRKIAEKIDLFNQWLVKQAGFTSTIIPIGDGIALSVKKKRERA